LTPVAEGCGLDTEPLSGKQEDVNEAMHPGDATATPTLTLTAFPVSTEAETTTAPTTTGESTVSTTEVLPTITGAVSGAPSAPTNGTGSYTSVS
jgi:hypothetical protein